MSIAKGITGYKGRVHVNFAPPITERFEDTKLLAVEMDRQILGGYRLFPVHYLAYAQWSDADPQLQVPEGQPRYSRPTSWPRPKAEWERRLNACPVEHRPFLVVQYATPVRNQYRVKAGIAALDASAAAWGAGLPAIAVFQSQRYRL